MFVFFPLFLCNVNYFMRTTFVYELQVMCPQEYFALDNLLMNVPCPEGVYVIRLCLLQYTYTGTHTHNGTRNTLKDKHRVAFTAQTVNTGMQMKQTEYEK